MTTKKTPPFIKSINVATRSTLIFIKNLPWRIIAVASGSIVGGIILLHTAAFLWPHTLRFSYADNCFANPVLFPGLVKTEVSKTYGARLNPTVAIGGFVVYSGTTCITARQTPKTDGAEVLQFVVAGFITKNVTIQGAPAPVVTVAHTNNQISAKGTLVFGLAQTDNIFSYQLTGNGKNVLCGKAKTAISCNLAGLELAQSAAYSIKLNRLFNGVPAGVALDFNTTTVAALQITATSIANGSTIYDSPTDFTITLNKPATAYSGLRVQAGGQDVPASYTLNGTTIAVHFEQPLARSTNFTVTLEHAVAADKGYLDAPYVLTFTTSGGPQVAGISIGSYKVATNATIAVTFDTNLAGGQDLARFIKLEQAGMAVGATYSLRGNKVYITPANTLARCSALTIKVLDGLKNEAGISGGSGNWQHNSRTVCQVGFSIGSSVNGRSITAYKFGDGDIKIVLVGAIHGDERSGAYMLNSLADYLETHSDKIPANHSIIIIPVANPDGYAANNRYNANGVDLNRNFPANNWKSGVIGPDGQYQENGGGSAPLSEPESRALANYVASQNPRLVLSYHAYAHLMAANEAGDSLSIARSYGNQTGYPVYGNDASGQFDYDTTGAFEDWLHDAHGIVGILIELRSKTGNEFSSHIGALLSLFQL